MQTKRVPADTSSLDVIYAAGLRLGGCRTHIELMAAMVQALFGRILN